MGDLLTVEAPARLTVSVPYAGEGPANVVLNGVTTAMTPVDGAVAVTVPAGRSTVLVDP